MRGCRTLQESPAVAAAKAANADAGEADFVGDPFRAPYRWADKRGRYEQVTYTDRDGNPWPVSLFGPRDADGGPYPGVLLVCHACSPLPQTTENVGLWYWAAESLAEAGYVVLYATVGGNNVSRTVDATDFFTATPQSPTAHGEFNPWYERLDRDRLGIVGHSGAAGVALNVGNIDPRYNAIAVWDPSASFSFTGVNPRVPTMIQVADYTLRAGPVPSAEKPVPAPGSKYTFFDTISAAGVDVMQVAPRATTHLDWTRFAGANPFGPSIDHGIYGEMVATYYTLAWLDRYVAPLTAAPTRKAERQSAAKAKTRAAAPHREWHRPLRPVCGRALDRLRAARRRRGEEGQDQRSRQRAHHHRWHAHPEPAVVRVRLPVLPQRWRRALRRHASPLPVIGGRP